MKTLLLALCLFLIGCSGEDLKSGAVVRSFTRDEYSVKYTAVNKSGWHTYFYLDSQLYNVGDTIKFCK